MTLVIKEYDLIQRSQDDDVRRKLLCTSKYDFYHDEDEDFQAKLWLRVIDEGGAEIANIVYTQRDSENRQYWDIGYVSSADLRRLLHCLFVPVIISPRSTTYLKRSRRIEEASQNGMGRQRRQRRRTCDRKQNQD